MATDMDSYIPRFICKKCDSTITIFEWRKGELCKKCRGAIKIVPSF
ncbi:MAG TPA: hypothetical protein VMV49_01130 [Candidatus Deferrimicrobium sp.]|nr:hypothetical protein [Candidatus Deferrimicrobium sp.]